MNISCDVVKDLLPLYTDGACSPGSERAVEAHIQECPDCRSYCESLRREAPSALLEGEAGTVMARHARRERRRSFTVGAVMGGIFSIPVLVCLIVNLTTGAALDWFFIVLTALMLTASLSVLPLMLSKHRFPITLLVSTLCLLLLLLVCALYTDGAWFLVAASACLLGISLVCLPIALGDAAIARRLRGLRGLLVMGTDTLLYALMLWCIGIYLGDPGFWGFAAALSAYPVGFAWLMFLALRYLPWKRTIRAGLCCMLGGVFLFSVEKVTGDILGPRMPWPVFTPLRWNSMTLDGNVKWSVLCLGLLLGLIFVVLGICRREKKK